MNMKRGVWFMLGHGDPSRLERQVRGSPPSPKSDEPRCTLAPLGTYMSIVRANM